MRDIIKTELSRTKQQFATRTSKAGSYSFLLTVIVLIILISVNAALSFLPDSYVQADLTANQLYSISSQSKVLLGTLEEDITIYWIVTSGNEDAFIEKLLNNYEDYSSHVSIVKKDPDLYPDFTSAYTDEVILNNSVIVECGDKYRYISYDDIYEYGNYTMYSMYSTDVKFAGEQQITSAISYCISDDLPVIYLLEGHGEAALSQTVLDAIETDNMLTESLSLLSYGSVPEEVTTILINAPSTDISETEKDMLIDYLEKGGRLLILNGTTDGEALTNLNAVAEYYGISVLEGVVVEGDSNHYVYGGPALLLPDMYSSEVTDSLIEESYHVVMPVSKALDISGADSDVTVTSLLETSEEAFLKADGLQITTYEKEEEDSEGAFTLAAMVTKDLEDDKQMQLVWIASSYMLEEVYNNYSSGANGDMVLNALEMMCEKENSISIRSKSMSYEYLTIGSSDASHIKILTIGVIPILYLVIGIVIVMRRRLR